MPAAGTVPGTQTILLFHPEGNADNNPTLHAWLASVINGGFQVTVVARAREHQTGNKPYRLQTYGRWYSKLFRILVDQVGSIWLARIVTRVRFYRLWSLDARHVVGVDRHGLTQAWSFGNGKRQRLGFFSFEIEFEDEIGAKAKRCERHASRDVSWWMSQDALRAGTLCRENGLDMRDCVTAPVASSGRAPTSSTRLRDDLGIPPDAQVIMSMGSLATWTMLPEILDSVGSWPPGWVLLIHERYAKTEETLNLLKPGLQLKPGRVFLSSHRATSPDDLAYVLSGVDLGLAFYSEQQGHPLLGRNLRYMGRSSGKISTFARHGVPVVTNLGAPVSDDLQEYSAGVPCVSPDDLPEVLKLINPQEYRSGAYAYFDEILDFARSEQTLLRLLDSNAASVE